MNTIEDLEKKLKSVEEKMEEKLDKILRHMEKN